MAKEDTTTGNALQTTRPLIEPIYSQAKPSETIALGKVRATFAHNEENSPREASVCMRFTPDERLCFTFQTGPANLMQAFRDISHPSKNDGKLTLTDRGVQFDAFCVSRKPSSENTTLLFVPTTSVVTATVPSHDITKATFHLFNFPDFAGPEDYSITGEGGSHEGWQRCGRVVLKADGWNITIAATDKTDDNCKALTEQGGFIITHMGKIERSDGSLFSTEQLADVLQCLHSFLSFALGRWAGVALPIGFDRDGNRVFEQWGLPMAASGPWKASCSWFDAHHGQLLTNVFPGFAKLWNDATWKQALRAALYWYLVANERGTGIGVDTGLVLAQTALERLAWTYCVEHRKMISSGAFEPRRLSAADKLRLMISTLDIPLPIPSHLSALHGKRGRKWDDAMDAITTIRNSVVHPAPKEKLLDGSFYDAWRLSLWYLDLVLLRLCRRQGAYANRLAQRTTGEVEMVPWAKITTDQNMDD